MLTKLICAVFPNAKESCIRETDFPSKKVKRKTSFKGLGINTKTQQGAELPFKDLPGLVPSDCFFSSKNDHIAVFGQLSDEYFNGNHILFRVEVDPCGVSMLFVGDSKIEIRDYYIAPQIRFYAWSVAAFFRCVRSTLRLCYGHDSFQGIDTSVSITEIFTHSKLPFKRSVIRHIYCSRIVSVQASVPCCKKCSRVFYRAPGTSNFNQSDNKNTDQKDIKDIIRGIALNIGENQLLLIESQMKSSAASKYGMWWPKELISMSLAIFNRNPSLVGWLVVLGLTAL